jgi:hypothetical protein
VCVYVYVFLSLSLSLSRSLSLSLSRSLSLCTKRRSPVWLSYVTKKIIEQNCQGEGEGEWGRRGPTPPHTGQ